MSIVLLCLSLIVILIIFIWADIYFGKRVFTKNNPSLYSEGFNDTPQLFTDGGEFFDTLFADIENAKHDISVSFFIVKKDALSRLFFQHLKEAAQRGVSVSLLIDRLGSFRIGKKVIKEIEEAGVRFAFSHTPNFPFIFFKALARNHRKIAVIDGEISYLGGFNVAKEYLGEKPKFGPWRDYHLRFTGDAVPIVQSVFAKDFAKAKQIKNEPHLNKATTPLEQKSYTFFISNGSSVAHHYIELFNKANASIFIGSPYFIPNHPVMMALVDAVKRGIKVSVLVPKKTDHLLVQEASYPYLKQLLELGCPVYQYEKGFYHGKLCMIDSSYVDIGTANFDRRSFFLNSEMNCLSSDQQLIKLLQQHIQQDIQSSSILTLDELTKSNPIQWTKRAVASFVAGLL
ncbi:phospholipase D-like domain-containing protein [Aureibacillus halotolerans]|uniref:Cardiolipin synthase n=1 Tax=Aureibacillus halotolerans TaxID=1508390 RepID=A0A4R6TYT1_9BACI|nr:phospholipase D-like domain-containing protein [Aureibacillus halotolerans]TDQ38761.1 cardiolipin synthase [Aureibacillus halotolerans]